MALAYPEGESFFDINLLKEGPYNASNLSDFYSNLLVEFVWNYPVDSEMLLRNETKARQAEWNHPRVKYNIALAPRQMESNLVPTISQPDHGTWTSLPFMYGPSEKEVKRRVDHNLCTSYGRLQKAYKGAKKEVRESERASEQAFCLRRGWEEC